MLLREFVIAQFTLRPSLLLKKYILLSKLTFNFCFYVKMIYSYYLLKVLLFILNSWHPKGRKKGQPSLKTGKWFSQEENFVI